MKKSLFVLGMMAAAAIFTGCSKPKEYLRVGVFEPTSGDNGAGGKQELLGILYAHQNTSSVTINGKEYTVQLKVVDNESSVETAPEAAKELIKNNVDVVLGSYGSAVSLAASEVFEKAGVPVIGVTCTNPQLTQGNSHYFRICFLDPFQGTVLANFALKTLRTDRAYCLAKLGDDYSVGLCNYFMESFKKLGGEAVYEKFPKGTTDFSEYIANAKKMGASVLFVPVSVEAASRIIKEAQAQNLSIPILAGDTWDSNVILSAARGTNLKIFITTYFVEGSTAPLTGKFVDRFHHWLRRDSFARDLNGGNDELAAASAMGYDAFHVALEAAKAAKSVYAKDLMRALPSVNYEGVSGPISFNADGDAIRDEAYVKQVNTEDGTWQFIAVQKIK